MLKTALEAASCLFFPKICEICSGVLPAQDTHGVCASCALAVLKISPPFCPACGRTSAYENTRCGQCRDAGFHFDRAYAVSFYEGETRRLLQAFKFGGRKSLKTFFADMLTEFISNHLDVSTVDAVTSVPMGVKKENERGFNQARLLSRLVAGKINKEDLSPLLKRNKSDKTQSLLNRTQREQNIAGSFSVKAVRGFTGKKILLIDDILTTGFTASECSKTLKKAGAASVEVLAIARGL